MLGNIPENLLPLSDNDIEKSERVDTLEEDESSLDSHRFSSRGTRRLPISNLSDELCEELASLYLFSEGKFGYRIFRKGKLGSMKYFNQWVLNYTKLFATLFTPSLFDPDYIFFALPAMQR